MFSIIDGAKEKYIKKYGVDPANPKIDIVNGSALPKEEVNKLVADGKIKLETDAPVEKVENNMTKITKNVQSSILSVGSNPYAINGIINEYIFVATDSRHRPTQAITQDTHNALYRFENFGIGVNTYWYWNYWSASDVSPASDTGKALEDLHEDTNWVRDSANDMIIGWMHNMEDNGAAWRSWPYSVCADTADGLDWPHDSIVQHEVTHNFDVPEVDSPLHPTCIMKYSSAYLGTDIWCTSCWNTVDYGIDH